MSEDREARLKLWADDHERTFRKAWDAAFEPKLQMFPSLNEPKPWLSKLGGEAKSEGK